MQSTIKSAKQGQSAPTPRPLHTETQPPYTAAFAALWQVYYTSFPDSCTGGVADKKVPAFHARRCMGWKIPYRCFFVRCGRKTRGSPLKICRVLPSAGGVKGAVHLVRAGAQEPQKSNIAHCKKREKEAVHFKRARPAVRRGMGAAGKAGRPEIFLRAACFSVPGAGSFSELPKSWAPQA